MEISTILYSMQEMRTNAASEKLLHHVGVKLSEAEYSFKEREVANSLYGLKKFFCDTRAVRYIISLLAKKIKGCKSMTGMHISMSMCSLQGKENSLEAEELISSLLEKVIEPGVQFGAKSVRDSFFGLAGFQNSPVTDKMLHALTIKLQECKEPLTADVISKSMQGFQESTATKRLLEILSQEVDDASNFQPADIALSIRGIHQAKFSCKIVEQKFIAKLNRMQFHRDKDLIMSGLGPVLRISNNWDSLSERVKIALRQFDDPTPPSANETMIKDFLIHQYPWEKTLCNYSLGGLELDVYMPKLRLSIEIDGREHQKPVKKLWDKSRDEYLMKNYGVHVHRLNNFNWNDAENHKETIRQLIDGII